MFYNLTLKRATGINHAVSGDFCGDGQQQIIASTGKSLSLWCISQTSNPAEDVQDQMDVDGDFCQPEKIQIQKVLDVDVFGCIRTILKFRARKESRDYLMVGSDSGKIVILKYDEKKNAFEKVLQETVGLTGCCRATPGQYLAIDSKTRAVMIGAFEKVKHVYVFSDDLDSLAFSKPMYNASTEKTLVYDMVDVDAPGNVLFACLETKYKDIFPNEEPESNNQFVAFYEFDNANQTISSIHREELIDNGNLLITVPSESGVLVCATNCIIYVNMEYPIVRCPIPRRMTDITKRPMIFVCATTYKVPNNGLSFLAQSEQGDIFKITLCKVDGVVNEIQMRYFDTVHVATALCILNILETVYLFVASDFGNHNLYKIKEGLGDDQPIFSSALTLARDTTFFFLPRTLRNLIPVYEVQSLSPIMHLKMVSGKNEHNEENTLLLVACGRGQSSTFRILQRVPENSSTVEAVFNEIAATPLEYTPRKFVGLPKSSNILIIETDHNAYTLETKETKKKELLKEVLKSVAKDSKLFNDTSKLVSDLLWKQSKTNIPNIIQCESGMWASVIHILDTGSMEMVGRDELEQNEAAFSLSLVKFDVVEEDLQFLLIGVAINLRLGYNASSSGRILTYGISHNLLKLYHKTTVEDCPTAICPFQGFVLIGVGGALRIYDFSEEGLFVKCEKEDLCNKIVSIHTMENHIIVGDAKNGFFYLLYKKEMNKLEIYSEDIDPSCITASCLWDNKLARADKFGNIFIVQLPSEGPNENAGFCAVFDKISPYKYPAKVESLASFHIGEIVSSLQIGALSQQSPEKVLVYATLSGSIGILAPLKLKKTDEDSLELFAILMQVINPPLCGRDHLSFRSYYYPVLNVIDGDLCEQIYSLTDEKKNLFSSKMSMSIKEISKILHNLRTHYVFGTQSSSTNDS